MTHVYRYIVKYGVHVLCIYRVKELKKDSPTKLTTMPKSQSQTSPQVEPAVLAQNTPKDSRKMAPALFHPSNIQFSSTPKLPPRRNNHANHSNGKAEEASPVNLSRVLKEAYETPIRGHKLQKTERRRGKEGMLGYPPVVVRREPSFKSSPLSLSRHSDNHYHSSGSSSGSRRSDRRYRHERDRHVSGDSVPDRERKDAAPVVPDTPPQTDPRKRLFSGSANDSDPVAIDLSSITKHSEGSQTEIKDSHPYIHHSSRKPSLGLPQPSTPRREPQVEVRDSQSTHSKVETSSHNHSSKSNNDIIEEHREIMSQLDVVIDKAKAAMQNAASPGSTDGSGALTANRTHKDNVVSSADANSQHAHTLQHRALQEDSLQVRRQQELLRTNKLDNRNALNGFSDVVHEPKHSVATASSSGAAGDKNIVLNGALLNGNRTNGFSQQVEHRIPPSSTDGTARNQRSANVEIVELAFSKLNQASSMAHTHRSSASRDYDNELFGAKSSPASSASSGKDVPKRLPVTSGKDNVIETMDTYPRNSLRNLKRDSAPTVTTQLHVQAGPNGTKTEESPKDGSPRYVNIPVERSLNNSGHNYRSLGDNSSSGDNNNKGESVPPSEDFLKSLVGLKMARELLNENLAKEETVAHDDQQSDLQRNYHLHLNMMNKNLKAAHLRPFEDLLGAPSSVRKETDSEMVVSPEIPVTKDGYSNQPKPSLQSVSKATGDAPPVNRILDFASLAHNGGLQEEITTDHTEVRPIPQKSSAWLENKNQQDDSKEVETTTDNRLSWSEVLSNHTTNLDVNQNLQKDVVENADSRSDKGRTLTTQSKGIEQQAHNGGIATQDHIKLDSGMTADVHQDCDKHSDTSTLDDVASLPGGDEGGATKAPQKLQVHAGSAFTKVDVHQNELGPIVTNNSTRHIVKPISAAASLHAKIETAAAEKMEKVDTSISPIKTEKLACIETGAMFSPIHPFPLTPCEKQVISIPSVITKTVLGKDASDLSDHSMQSSSCGGSMQDQRTVSSSSSSSSTRRAGQLISHDKLRDKTLQPSTTSQNKTKTFNTTSTRSGYAATSSLNFKSEPSRSHHDGAKLSQKPLASQQRDSAFKFQSQSQPATQTEAVNGDLDSLQCGSDSSSASSSDSENSENSALHKSQ